MHVGREQSSELFSSLDSCVASASVWSRRQRRGRQLRDHTILYFRMKHKNALASFLASYKQYSTLNKIAQKILPEK